MDRNRRIFLSVVTMFAMSLSLGVIGRALLLQASGDAPGDLLDVLRQLPYAQQLVLAHFCVAIGFVWIYLRQREDGPFLAQGLRFGATVAVFMILPLLLVHHAAQPAPDALLASQVLTEGFGVTLMGVVVAWLNA